MKRAIHSLFRRGEANLLKILCLGVGLALGLVLLAEVIYQRSSDGFIPRLDDTYRVEALYGRAGDKQPFTYPRTSGAIATGIKDACPEVEAATRFTTIIEGGTFFTEDRIEIKGNLVMADSSFFDVFPRRTLVGEDPHTGLNRAHNAYVSHKLLADTGVDIVGKTITFNYNEGIQVTVAGVFEALPENSHLQGMDILVAMPTYKEWLGGYDGPNNWFGNDRYNAYLRLRPGTDPLRLQPGINGMIERVGGDELRKSGQTVAFQLIPVRGFNLRSGIKPLLNSLFLVFGLIMLAVAVLNYILLTLSSMVNRAKSIATYRCFGAGRRQIARMILTESFLHVVCIGLPLALLLILGLQDIIQVSFEHSLASLFPTPTLAVCAAVVLAVCAACGVLPGYLYTKIPVTYAYRRYTESKRRWKLGLLFVQFMLAALFVNVLAVLFAQYGQVTRYNLGFDHRNVVEVSLRGVPRDEVTRCAQELERDAMVEGVACSYQALHENLSGNNVRDINDEYKEYMNVGDMYDVTPNFLATMRIPLIEGPGFTPELNDSIETEVMVSRKFADIMHRQAGWEGSVIGRQVKITEHGRVQIVGVYEDIIVGSLLAERFDERATAMFCKSMTHNAMYWMYIRVRQMTPEVVGRVQGIVDATLTTHPKTVEPLSGLVEGNYRFLKNMRNAIMSAGLCTVLVMLIGLAAYLRDEVSRRQSEIAIRRIVGASEVGVQRLFLRRLFRTALPAIALGVLLAVAVGFEIVGMFAVKVSMARCAPLLMVATVALSAVMVAVAAGLVHRAARANPADNLRTE